MNVTQIGELRFHAAVAAGKGMCHHFGGGQTESALSPAHLRIRAGVTEATT